MLIKAKNIINAKALTQSKKYLGKVIDFEIDMNFHQINKYHIQTDLLGFLKQPLIIDSSQVITFKNKKLIVEDAVIKETQTEKTSPKVEYVK